MADVNMNPFHIKTLLRIEAVSLLLYTNTPDANESPGLSEARHNRTPLPLLGFAVLAFQCPRCLDSIVLTGKMSLVLFTAGYLNPSMYSPVIHTGPFWCVPTQNTSTLRLYVHTHAPQRMADTDKVAITARVSFGLASAKS